MPRALASALLSFYVDLGESGQIFLNFSPLLSFPFKEKTSLIFVKLVTAVFQKSNTRVATSVDKGIPSSSGTQ